MSRVPSLPPDQMDPEQRRIYEEVLASRGTWADGPFPPLIHQPRIAAPTHKLGEFVRYHTSLGPRLSELVILVVARHWDCHFEWHQHAAIALRSDVPAEVVEAIRNGQRPQTLREDAAVVHDYAVSVLQQHRVEADLYARATALFGVVGVVELTSLIGYYTMLALSLNAHEVPLPPGLEPPLPIRSLR